MSAGAIIAITVGGVVVVAALIVWLVVWLRKSYNAQQTASLGRLQEESVNRGWRYEERNDSYAAVFNAQNEFAVQSPLQVLNPLNPYHLAPKAVDAKEVVTGTHRGRPFIAALFGVHHRNEYSQIRAIWVRTPAARPALTVSAALRAQSRVRASIGQQDLQLGNPDFDERFEVSAGDDRFAQAVLNPRMIQFLLADQRAPRGFMLLGDQLDVLDPVSDHRDPAELIPALDYRCDLLDLIPPSVWQ
ncbi:MAG: hypothetical protein JWQ81_272 [Amycolatopsis sp.]|jgi:hypothetical protein|uniref:hypothetical protein n=1 Tax=Amycolatopsis sp. TaxID=37632 RepID=UPI00260C205F|nr:hypothetical protein [Amycolatopsis sp.]MCU1679533.1 hypothetical protein [Amycolatopsis sp.]